MALTDVLADLFFLCLAVGGIWLWLDSLRAREVAVQAAESGCAEEGVQFLDQTVVIRRLRLGRDEEGRLRLQRTYGFEYSDTGNNRRPGTITLLGHEVEVISVLPHLYVVPKAEHHEQHH